jgi:hypothetical protein
VSGTVGAVLSSDSAENANRTNRRNARDTNTTNVILNMLARGGTIDAATAHRLGLPDNLVGQSSAVLPYYLSDIEQSTGMQAGALTNAIQSLYASPELEMADYQRILGKYQPGFDANQQFATDIATGAETNKILGEAAPVFQARTDVATGKKNAALESLKETLNDIDAIQARKGYTGDTFGNRLLKFNARRSIATQGADDLGQAALQNAIEKAGLQQSGRQMRLNNVNLGDTLSRSDISRRALPGTATAQRFNTSLGPLQFFNIGPHQFTPFQNLPNQNPETSPWQLAAQGAAGVGNTALNYYLQNNLQRNASGAAGAGAAASLGSGAAANTGFTGTGYADQWTDYTGE